MGHDGTGGHKGLLDLLRIAALLGVHRVPAPEGKAVILTTAEVGEVVEDPDAFVAEVVAAQPCDSSDRRRMTSSRQWKAAGDTSTHRWDRVGTSHKPLARRLEV